MKIKLANIRKTRLIKTAPIWFSDIFQYGCFLAGGAVRSLVRETDLRSPREIIQLARIYKGGHRHGRLLSNVKNFSNSKDRRATRDAIKTEDFDKIPQNDRTKTEDPWNWS